MMKHYSVGYTQGVFDMFHIGHLNLLLKAKEYCDYLIVGINSDKLVQDYKKKTPIVCETDRKRIVENIKCVDKCIIVSTLDKKEILKEIEFNVIFIGDDWINDPRWIKTRKEMGEMGIDVVFLPYTTGISSTVLRPNINDRVKENEK